MAKKNGIVIKDIMAMIRHPWVIIISILVITVVFAYFGATKTTMDNDLTRMINENNPSRIRLENTDLIFGAGNGVLISLTGENAFSTEMVKTIDKITKKAKTLNVILLRDILKEATSLLPKKIKTEDFEKIFAKTQSADNKEILNKSYTQSNSGFFILKDKLSLKYRAKLRDILINAEYKDSFETLFKVLSETDSAELTLDKIMKLLTDKSVLARKLNISVEGSQQDTGQQQGNIDPDDTASQAGTQTQRQPEQSSQKPLQRSVDPDDRAEYEEITASESIQYQIEEIISHFTTNKEEIQKVYEGFNCITDKLKKFKIKWYDDTLSFTNTDYPSMDFADKTPFYKLFKNSEQQDIDLLLAILLEKNINTREKLIHFINNESEFTSVTGISLEGYKKIAEKFPFDNFISIFKKQELQIKTVKLIEPIEGQPITAGQLALLKARVLNYELFHGSMLSYDKKSSVVMIKFIPNIKTDEVSKTYKYIEKFVNDAVKETNGKIIARIAGEPVVVHLLSEGMGKDMGTLFPFVVLVVILTLYLSFRHIRGVVLPLTTVVISAIWAMGLMAITKTPVSSIATTIPTILIAVGSAYGIHVVNYYYISVGKGVDKTEAVSLTMKKVGLAVLLAGLTTIAGFASNIFTEVIPIKEFGFFSAFGVIFALIISMIFIPAWLRVGKLPKKMLKHDIKVKTHEDFFSKQLEKLGKFTYKRKYLLIVILIALFALSLFGMKFLNADMDNISMFKSSSTIRLYDKFINQNFSGTSVFSVVFTVKDEIVEKKKQIFDKSAKELENIQNGYNEFLIKFNAASKTDKIALKLELARKKILLEDAQKRNKSNEIEYLAYKSGIIRPEFLKMVEDLQKYLTSESYEGHKNIGKVVSIVDTVKKVSQTFNYGDPSEYKVPSNLELASFYITSFHSTQTDTYLDVKVKPFRNTRVIIQMKDSANAFAQKTFKAVDEFLKTRLETNAYEMYYTGMVDLKIEVNNVIISGQISSIIASLVAVFLIILIAYRTFVGAIISIIPLGLTILFNFGLMGFAGIKLNASTALVASLAIGIGVDYTIHYINTFREESRVSTSIEDITVHTSSHSGRAIIINVLSVAFGFLVLVVSNFSTLIDLGLLTAITMFVSGIASIIFIPAILNIFKPKSFFLQKGKDNGKNFVENNKEKNSLEETLYEKTA